MTEQLTVIGGGLVGSLLALQLKKRGHRVIIFEKRKNPFHQEDNSGRSINLIITSRGLRALSDIGLLSEVLKLSVPVRGRMIHPRTGELTYQAYGRDPSECNYSISRAVLNRHLLTECLRQGIDIQFEHQLLSADFSTKKLSLTTPKGIKELPYHRLFGTDGAGSVLRESMGLALGKLYQNQTDYLPVDYKELFLPLTANKECALGEKNALHIWPRGSHMLMALPNQDGSFTLTLYLPNSQEDNSFSHLATESKLLEFFAREFPDALNLIPNLSGDFFKNPQGKLGTVRSSPWIYQDSVALLGDAAHAIVPFFGQGMNLGFEDCSRLTEALDSCKVGARENWTSALSLFDQQQRPNANSIADMAIENLYEMRDKVGDKKFQLKKQVEALIEKELPEKYRARYGMITYTLIPYHLAQESGLIQDKILDQLCEGLTKPEDLNWEKAKFLIESEFTPFVKKHNLDLRKYKAAYIG